MIVIYPLLLSDTVSKNIVPGLAKVIERYLLIYKMDEILQSAKSGGYRKRLKVQGGKIIDVWVGGKAKLIKEVKISIN